MTKKISTIHHLSCTGGTLISKCLASMPNSALLSEVNPYNVGPLRFNPFDPVQQLFSQNIIDKGRRELEFVFKSRIEQAYNLANAHGLKLILRDHTHSDYLTGSVPKGDRRKSLLNCLKYDFEVESVLTLRNPVDTFLSLEKNGWSKGVKTFDEYCRRTLIMLESYDNASIYHYEDFCFNPDDILEKMCMDLGIDFDPSYKKRFFEKKLTGDSGRGKEIKEIKPLPRREYDDLYLKKVYESENFAKLVSRFPFYSVF